MLRFSNRFRLAHNLAQIVKQMLDQLNVELVGHKIADLLKLCLVLVPLGQLV